MAQRGWGQTTILPSLVIIHSSPIESGDTEHPVASDYSHFCTGDTEKNLGAFLENFCKCETLSHARVASSDAE